MGKQGAKRPDNSGQSNNFITMDPDIPLYCYKPADQIIKEVQSLMRQYSCPLCQHNGHPLHDCSSLARVYTITLKSPSTTNPFSRFSFNCTIVTLHLQLPPIGYPPYLPQLRIQLKGMWGLKMLSPHPTTTQQMTFLSPPL